VAAKKIGIFALILLIILFIAKKVRDEITVDGLDE
jgi:hypothetical protein